MKNYHGIFSHDASVRYGYAVYKDADGKEYNITCVVDAENNTVEQALASYNWKDTVLVFSGLVTYVRTVPGSAHVIRKSIEV